MPVSPDEAPASPQVFGETAAVLLLAPGIGPRETPACREFMAAPPDPTGANVLLVTLTPTPRDRLTALAGHFGDHPPNELVVVAAGPLPDAALDPPASLPDAIDHTVETVPDPGDLTGLGTRITGIVSDWDDDVFVCFHSLTTLLLYADLHAVHRFLQVINGHLAMKGALTHYHMDPAAHDEETLTVLRTLFDGVVEADGEREWTVVKT